MKQQYELPTEIEKHIIETSTGLFEHLKPCKKGVTSNLFFQPNEEINHIIPSTEPRNVSLPLPKMLKELYEKYPHDIEFSNGIWTFLSELEIKERYEEMCKTGQLDIMDVAISYSGMGHVVVLSVYPETMMVFEMMDGGSNGYEREANVKRRQQTNVKKLEKKTMEKWFVENFKTKKSTT